MTEPTLENLIQNLLEAVLCVQRYICANALTVDMAFDIHLV